MALSAELAAAEEHAGSLPALDEALVDLRARLEQLSVCADGASASDPAVGTAAAAEQLVTLQERLVPATLVDEEASLELETDELRQATADFDASRRIGSGGFGQVFLGDALPSLAERWRQERVAVKRADLTKLEPADLAKEVVILRRCDHPHLLPLLGFCLQASAACLVFPLMVGGSLQVCHTARPSIRTPAQQTCRTS